MAIDFRASQVQTNKIIASGSTGTGAKILMYGIDASSTSSPNQGVINDAVFNTGSIGTDVFLYVSGGLTTGSSGQSVFGGSVRVSGSANIGSGLGGNGTNINYYQVFWDAYPSPEGAFVAVLDGNTTPESTASQNLTLRAGGINPSGSGGAVIVRAGDAGYLGNPGDNTGGHILIYAGTGGSGSVNGWNGSGGDVRISAGSAGTSDNDTTADGGNVIINAGGGSAVAPNNSGNGGYVQFTLGAPGSVSSSAGSFSVLGGTTTGLDYTYGSGSRIEFGPGETSRVRKFVVNATANPFDPAPISLDSFFYVSGTITASNSSYPSVAVFAGDVVVSGNLMSTMTKTFVPIGSYTATTATSSNPQVAGQAYLARHEVPARSVILRTILSTTDAAVTASVQLWNITSGSFVEIGGTGVTTLTTTSTTPVALSSSNLINATNFSPVFGIYEVRVYVATGSASAVHGSSMFVCGA